MQRKIRVLVGKPGLDGHDRGAKVVAAALRDAGMEVIYTGLHQTPAQVVEAGVQEDVDVMALSVLSGAHMTLFPEVFELMNQHGIGDRLLTGGGIIPAEDMEALKAIGVGRLFGPGSSTQDIVAYIREWFISRHGADSLAPLPAPPDRSEPMVSAEEIAHHSMPRPAAARAGVRPAMKSAPAARGAAKAKSKAGSKPARSKPATKPAKRKAAKPAKRKTSAKPARVKRKPAARTRASAKPARRKAAARRR